MTGTCCKSKATSAETVGEGFGSNSYRASLLGPIWVDGGFDGTIIAMKKGESQSLLPAVVSPDR